MREGHRKLQISILVAIFFAQTWLVYSDEEGRAAPPLSEQAARGWEIWHAHNCQACHQLYGFGGFLGPDLTNAAPHLTDARLESVLTVGAGQMPAFHLDEGERAALRSFLEELDATGVGQLRLAEPEAPAARLDRLVEELTGDDAPLDEVQALGRAVVAREGCIGCHLPNPYGPAGANTGTDLGTLVAKLGADGVRGIVSTGIPAKGMPAIRLSEEEADGLVAFLAWLAPHGELLQESFANAPAPDAGAFRVPWFDYE